MYFYLLTRQSVANLLCKNSLVNKFDLIWSDSHCFGCWEEPWVKLCLKYNKSWRMSCLADWSQPEIPRGTNRCRFPKKLPISSWTYGTLNHFDPGQRQKYHLKRHQSRAALASQTHIKLRNPSSKGIFKASLFAFGAGLQRHAHIADLLQKQRLH